MTAGPGWWHPEACSDRHDDAHNCLDSGGSIIGWRDHVDDARLSGPSDQPIDSRLVGMEEAWAALRADIAATETAPGSSRAQARQARLERHRVRIEALDVARDSRPVGEVLAEAIVAALGFSPEDAEAAYDFGVFGVGHIDQLVKRILAASPSLQAGPAAVRPVEREGPLERFFVAPETIEAAIKSLGPTGDRAEAYVKAAALAAVHVLRGGRLEYVPPKATPTVGRPSGSPR